MSHLTLFSIDIGDGHPIYHRSNKDFKVPTYEMIDSARQ